jgi:long-chain acyl-CoA synthetase
MKKNSRFERDIYAAIVEICDTYKDNVLFRFAGKDFSFGDTFEKIISRAVFLQQQGISKGDIVGILSANSPAWCSTLLAIISIGAIALPLDTNLSKKQHEEMLIKAGATAIYTGDGFQGAYPVRSFDIDAVERIKNNAGLSAVGCSPDDIGVLIFTSRTTGTPKIVTLSHRNLLHIAYNCTDLEAYTSNDQTLAILPLFHVYALESTFLAPFVTGSMIVLLNSLKGPDIMQAMADNDITIFPAAPIMWELFFDGIAGKVKAESEKKYTFFMFMVNHAPLLRKSGLGFLLNNAFAPVHDLFGHSLRFFISGGAPLKRAYFNYYKNMGFHIMEGYGLSETTGPIAIPYYKNAEAGSVGPPIPGNEVKIKDINEDGIGEIWFRGFAVSPGYFKNDEENRTSFDDEGFFNTGDLGRVDHGGNIHITGRLKNVIVLDSGKNVYPEEMEFFYRRSEKISDIAIFERKINDRTMVYAVVVPLKKNKNSYQEIKAEIEFLNRGLPDYRRVKNFSISFDALPENSTRKVMYHEVIKLLEEGNYQTGTDDRVVLKDILRGSNPREKRIVELLRKKLKADLLFANNTPSDFNIDSLGTIDLIVFLEQNLTVVIDARAFIKKETMGDILAYLSSLKEGEGSSLDRIILNGKIGIKPNKIFNPFHHVLLGLAKVISKIFWKLTVVNPDRLNLHNNILVSNHQSYLDMVWIAFSIPGKQRKQIYVTGKRKRAFLRFIFPILPVIYVDSSNGIAVLKAGADILRQGKTLIIFPEGTRTADGNLGDFMSGAAYLAKNLNKDIIPVSVDGGYKIWPRHHKFPTFITDQKGYLTVGEIIKPADYDSVASLNAALFRAVAAGLVRDKANDPDPKDPALVAL